MLGGMNPEMVAFVWQVTRFGVCSKCVGALNSPLCQEEMDKVIRIGTASEGWGASLYSQKVQKSRAGSLTP